MSEEETPQAEALLGDVVIVSDLHMGRGINPETRRFFPLENFFYDADFHAFCEYLSRQAAAAARRLTLVLNGDTFDLLRIEPPAPVPQGTTGEGQPSGRDRRFGPVMTPAQAARTVAEIMAGHPGFVAGLAQLLNAGHKVVFLPGNHDIEVQWLPVQEEVRAGLMAQVLTRYGEGAVHEAACRVDFRPWFYHEPGRLWVEHGCQYDPENSFRYLLREGLANLPDAIVETEHDLPLGNFFQRYLYNFFGNLTFIVPSSRANLRYLKWLLLHQPRLLLRVAVSHGPFVFQVLRRLARAQRSARQALREVHDAALRELAEKTGLGERLMAIDALKEVRANAALAFRGLALEALRVLGFSALVAGLVIGVWFLSFWSISSLHIGVGGKAILFFLCNLGLAVCITAAMLYSLFDDSADVGVRPLRRAAAAIARALDVPLVCFGHSHDEELWRTGGLSDGRASWYGNTGTWIAVFTHDVLLPRERVQYTFLQVTGDDAQLMHWSPGRGQPMPVVLLDDPL